MPLGLVVEGANRHDMKLVRATLHSLVVKRPPPTAEQPQGMCLDKGYDYQEVRQIWKSWVHRAYSLAWRGSPGHQRPREQKARRWVVERTRSWMNAFDVSWCAGTKSQTLSRFLHLACA